MDKCLCPKTGNSHFHLMEFELIKRNLICVNALERATLISTLGRASKNESKQNCVNALRRATLISTEEIAEIVNQALCQCPKTGNSHFHKTCGNKEVAERGCVNALRRATLISTNPSGIFNGAKNCVNALRRATLISTVVRVHLSPFWLSVSMP